MQTAIVHSKVPLLADVDVLIIGAGSAGCCAALAARELKRHSVMLVDRLAFPGGTSTAVLDTFYGFFTPGESPRKVVGGLPDRVVDALDATGDIFLRPNTYGAGTGVTYNPERLKRVWDQLLGDAGVKLLLHSFLVDVEVNAGGAIVAVVIATKAGLARVKAKRYIDASGDAEPLSLGGHPRRKGRRARTGPDTDNHVPHVQCRPRQVRGGRRPQDAQ